jgi:hypothetical protein
LRVQDVSERSVAPDLQQTEQDGSMTLGGSAVAPTAIGKTKKRG